MRRSFVLATACAILVTAAGFVPACGANDDAAIAALAANCAIDSDCTNPLVCAFQTCHVQCATTSDCTSQGLGLCIETDKPYKVCQNAKEEDCTRNSECPGAEVCAVDEKCRDACVSAKDCVTGQSCVSGVCADPSALVNGALPVGLQDGGAGVSGEPCTYATVCPGALVCLRGICTEECITDKDCELSFVCQSTRCVPAGYTGSVPMSGDASVRDGATSDASGGGDGASDASDAGDACPSGLTLCGGACIDTTSSAKYCHAPGACGAECPSGQYCSGGTCSSTCNPPSQICGPNNSCVDTKTDPANCSGCGLSCDLPHVTVSACSSSACIIGKCATGFGDCNGVSGDGCEVDTQTSATNCGACRVACAAPASCSNGTCSGPVTLATGQDNPRFLAVDGLYVYWANQGAGTVARTLLNGTGSVSVIASGQNKPTGIYVGGILVYWTNTGDNTSNGSIAAVSPNGTGNPVMTIASGEGEPYNLVSDGNNLYWADTLSGLLRTYSLAVQGNASTVATINSASPYGIAVAGGYAYAIESSSGGSIVRVNLSNGSTLPIANSMPGYGIATDGTSVYWPDDFGQYVEKTPVGGGASTQLAMGQTAQQFVTDGTSLYWTNSSGTIMKVAVAGGTPTAIATGQSSPFGLVISGNSLFWGNIGDGTIMKLTPR